MRIDDLNRTSVTPGVDSGQTAQKVSQDKETVAGSDQAEISHLAQSLAASDPARIEQLRLQVQSESYDVSAQAVANALIDAHVKD